LTLTELKCALDTILRQFNQIHIFITSFLKIQLTITLQSTWVTNFKSKGRKKRMWHDVILREFYSAYKTLKLKGNAVTIKYTI